MTARLGGRPSGLIFIDMRRGPNWEGRLTSAITEAVVDVGETEAAIWADRLSQRPFPETLFQVQPGKLHTVSGNVVRLTLPAITSITTAQEGLIAPVPTTGN